MNNNNLQNRVENKSMTYNNFGFYNKSGILMAVSSLSSKYGIGSFGSPCFNFIDFLDKCGQKCWQVLPLNPTSYGDSPYQSPSSFAGNPYFIDLDVLFEKGLLTSEELKSQLNDAKAVDYGFLFQNRYDVLRKAFSRFKPNSEYFNFIKENDFWLQSYAVFMALKVKYNFKPWWEWDDRDKFYTERVKDLTSLSSEMDFWKFIQYEFFTEWQSVLNYAHKKGVLIIGDMPIYVARDSVDVYTAPDNYILDYNLNPKLVAGVPPDGFSPDGQLWGNPIYNYDLMEKENYSWWILRVKHSKKLYDLLRIDHFRGFCGYYVVPSYEKTAKNGWWMQGPKNKLFNAIFNEVKDVIIIAEDLGVITEDVKEFLKSLNFPGMKVLQFAFSEDDSMYLPKNYESENCVVYTGTHDSDTTLGWLKTLNTEEKARFYSLCPKRGIRSDVYALISLALSSKANLSIIPLQDYLELDGSSRMNTPAVSEKNWAWRVPNGVFTTSLISKIRRVNKKYNRIK